MAKCSIEVIKKTVNKDIQDMYANTDIVDGECTWFQVGDKFIYEQGGTFPEGFCPWAWADLHREIEGTCLGADFHWVKGDGTMISCCTDGFRPVVFRIQRIED